MTDYCHEMFHLILSTLLLAQTTHIRSEEPLCLKLSNYILQLVNRRLSRGEVHLHSGKVSLHRKELCTEPLLTLYMCTVMQREEYNI